MKDIGDQVWELIQKNADRGGMVDMESFWNDCEALPINGACIEGIIKNIVYTGLIWLWHEQIIVVRPFLCPDCGPVHELVTIHMKNCRGVQRKLYKVDFRE
jgi:hypothetical protein